MWLASYNLNAFSAQCSNAILKFDHDIGSLPRLNLIGVGHLKSNIRAEFQRSNQFKKCAIRRSFWVQRYLSSTVSTHRQLTVPSLDICGLVTSIGRGASYLPSVSVSDACPSPDEAFERTRTWRLLLLLLLRIALLPIPSNFFCHHWLCQ